MFHSIPNTGYKEIVTVKYLLLRPPLEQEAHHLQMALRAGKCEGGLLELVEGVYARAVAHENLK